MKKKIISGMLSVLMLASASIGSMAFAEGADPQISFVDEQGNAVTSAPDLGKIKIADVDGAGAKFFATYDKDGRFRSMSAIDEAVYVNEWAKDTYTKAFAFDSLDNIKTKAPAKKVELSTEGRELIVSYADGLPSVTESGANDNKIASSVQTYGNAKSALKLEAKHSNAVKLSETNKTALKNGTYNVVKVRYYAGTTDKDRFNLVLAKNSVYGTLNNVQNPYAYTTVIPQNVGWNVAVINLDTMKQYYSDNALSIADAEYWDIMTGGANSVLWGSTVPNGAISSLYIDSVWLDNVKLTSDTAIDFSSDKDWEVISAGHLAKSTEQKYGNATQSAKVKKVTDNGNYFFDLKKIGFKTDWSNYKTISIRYYTNDTSKVPAVYLATKEEWVTWNNTTDGSFKMAKGTYAKKKPTASGWNTVTYILPNSSNLGDFTRSQTDTGSYQIQMNNIPYLLIPNHAPTQYWNESTAPYDNITGMYIDKIWLSEDIKLKDNTKIDFGDYYTWDVMGTMTQFQKNTQTFDKGKALSAKMYATTGNETGFFDLAKIGFTTDWSKYKTINIRYYTDDVTKVPPVYLATEQKWVTSTGGTGGTNGSFKIKSGVYNTKKSGITSGWNTVSYTLGANGDFQVSQQNAAANNMKWTNVKYLLLPNYKSNASQYWSGDESMMTEVTYQSGAKGKEYDLTGIYVDSIWLSE